MKKITVFLLAVMLVLSACAPSDTPTTSGDPGTSTPASSDAPVTTVPPAEGLEPLEYLPTEDMEFTWLYSAETAYLNPLDSASTANDFNYLMMDTLLLNDQYGLLRPGMALTYDISDDGLVYTFKLREGVMWYTNEGEEYAEVTSQDWMDAMEYILTAENASPHSAIVGNMILNADEFWDVDNPMKDFSQVGIKAPDKYTIEYTLKTPAPYFLKLTTYYPFFPLNGQFMEEQGEFFAQGAENMLSFGAYYFTEFASEDKRVFEINPNYYYADKMFIQEIEYRYNKEAVAISPEMFQRGEIDYFALSATTVDEWINDPELVKLIMPAPLNVHTTSILLNYNPRYDEEYDPDSWRIAVNNLNFRKSIFWALDNETIMKVYAPYDWEQRLVYSLSLPGFVTYPDGTDFATVADFDDYNSGHYVDVALAQEYRDKAITELEAAGATLPIQCVFPYSTSSAQLAQMREVISDMVMTALGEDYITFHLIPEAPTGYSDRVSLAGKFSMSLSNWGPDYADPHTMTDTWHGDSEYAQRYGNYFDAEEWNVDGGHWYNDLVNAAHAETLDVTARYDMYAEAERYLIENAMLKPIYRSGGGYVASIWDPFSAFTKWGGYSIMVPLKGMKLYNRPISMEEYPALLAEYEEKRIAATAEYQNYVFGEAW